MIKGEIPKKDPKSYLKKKDPRIPKKFLRKIIMKIYVKN